MSTVKTVSSNKNLCLLTCNRRALRHSLHPHYKPNHVLQHSEPAGQLIDVAGWHCRGSR